MSLRDGVKGAGFFVMQTIFRGLSKSSACARRVYQQERLLLRCSGVVKKVARNMKAEMKDGTRVVESLVGYSKLRNP